MPLFISGSNGISGADGTAALPAVQGTDGNTGVFFPAADQVAIATGGVQRLLVDASGNVTTGLGSLYPLVSGTAVASTSGTSIDFTGIPSWVRRVTVMFNGVSTNGTSGLRVQLGISTGVETSGYSGGALRTSGGTLSTVGISSGFDTPAFAASTEVQNGQFIVSLLQSSNNIWVCAGSLGGGTITNTTAGSKTLAGSLDRVRITTVNGTDVFDAGSINILFE